MSSFLLNDLKNFNEIFKENVTYDNLKKVSKDQGLTLSLLNTIVERHSSPSKPF